MEQKKIHSIWEPLEAERAGDNMVQEYCVTIMVASNDSDPLASDSLVSDLQG